MRSRLPLTSIAKDERFQTGAAVAFIVVFVLAAFWKLALMKGLLITDDVFASDLMNENFPYRFSLGNALHSGHLPLWAREIYGGFPLLARADAGICYPFNLLLFGLLPPYLALNLTILLTVATAGIGMYLYAREIGGKQLASLLAAVAFCLSGYMVSHLKHPSLVNAACWMPLALTLLERAVNRNHYRCLLWFGIVFGLQHLSGNAQTAYYSGLLYLFYFPFRLLGSQRTVAVGSRKPGVFTSLRDLFKNKLAWSFVGVLVLGSLLAAIQLIPTYEMVSLSQRSGGVTFEYASRYAYDPKDFWTFFYPYINGDKGDLTYTGKGIFWEDYGYAGVVTLLLAVFAVLRGWRRWHVRFFSFCALLSYLLVLGPATPLYRFVFDYLPGMTYFRFPTRFLFITDGCLAILASLGLTTAIQRFFDRAPAASARRLRRSHTVQGALLLFVVADLLYFQLRQNPVVDAAQWMKPPKTAGILNQDASLFRVFCVGGNQSHKRAFRQARGWEGDLRPFVEQREFLQPSSNVLYGLSSPAGYANLTPNYIVDIWGDQNRAGLITRMASTQGDTFQPVPAFWNLMRMSNVKYITSFWPFAATPKLRTLGIHGGAYLYQNDDFLPRAYLVADVSLVANDAAALTVLTSDAFAPERSVLLRSVPPNYHPSEGAVGSVEMVHYTTNEAEMKVQALRDAILVFSDSYYPGWIAEVDGRPTAIYRANLTQRAVVVPAGEHKVRFRFRPASVLAGFFVSGASLLVFLGCFFIPPLWKNRSSRRADAPLRGKVHA